MIVLAILLIPNLLVFLCVLDIVFILIWHGHVEMTKPGEGSIRQLRSGRSKVAQRKRLSQSRVGSCCRRKLFDTTSLSSGLEL